MKNIVIIIFSVIVFISCVINAVLYGKLHRLYTECIDKIVYKKSHNFIQISNFIIGLLTLPYAYCLVTM